MLKGSWLELCSTITNEEDGSFFRHDTDDSDPKEQWDNYCEVTEELSRCGLVLLDPYTEHDCISGMIGIKDD